MTRLLTTLVASFAAVALLTPIEVLAAQSELRARLERNATPGGRRVLLR